ncbi:glucosamine-6-phosphate deaminase [Alkalihalobacillus xiaoxiensis]|uniref:Glucosamine-6-phosphate deaminase n=1 Tax=Shouchella xiaoxiensis TaxID=766895 RepID=A0ABS2SR11_9BACI|nr:glucosamine-6-phosphate deaminase [Shouchella xiaoxiensis]MBM7837928.1 glucosamine-6-phosphate deaminase [Shouchella xiaoxiensis]
MNVIYVKDSKEMSEKAASLLFSRMKTTEGQLNLGLATGGTPQGTYEELIKKTRAANQSFAQVKTFNLDEYVGLSEENHQSYRYYMNTHFFNHIDIPIEQTFLPNGMALNLEEECARYEQLIIDNGGIDVQLLGIGSNGHIGFNEPGTPFSEETHLVKLAQETKEANARYFNDQSEVPSQAITMGIASIMRAKEIVLLISGENKADAFAKFMNGTLSEQFPASILETHENVTVIVDEAAANKMN